MTGRRGDILVIDDESGMRHMLRLILQKEGYQVSESPNGKEALKCLQSKTPDFILCDIRMPEMDGLDFLSEAFQKGCSSTVIMMSAYGTVETALECMKKGAYDYISKPFKKDEVVLTLKKAEERLRLKQENRALRKKLIERNSRPMIYRSDAMGKVAETIEKVAQVSSPILITGETGTGKEVVARAIHERSRRRNKPFCAVNCSAIAPGLVESELFGHARGAFTGAEREHPGFFGSADGGTLFLDEIGELPLEVQPKLLRALQEGEIRRVGESRPRRIDVRLLAATTRDLKADVEAARFRDDLYYRLAVVEIPLPPLRERPQDIPPLVEHFLHRIAEREGRAVPVVAPEVIFHFQGCPWPGNVRELENFLEKTMIFFRGERLELSHLPGEIRRRNQNPFENLSLKQATTRLECEYIRKALAATGGNRTQAARLLGISLRGLMYKLKEMGEP